MANILQEFFESAAALAKGFSVTFRTMLRPGVTENYPDEPVRFEGRFRGLHVLRRDENGLEKCVGCFQCAAACPAHCILYRSGRKYLGGKNQRGRALRRGLQHRLQSLHFLRLLRRSLPYRRHRTRPRFRNRRLQRCRPRLPKRAASGGLSRSAYTLQIVLIDSEIEAHRKRRFLCPGVALACPHAPAVLPRLLFQPDESLFEGKRIACVSGPEALPDDFGVEQRTVRPPSKHKPGCGCRHPPFPGRTPSEPAFLRPAVR